MMEFLIWLVASFVSTLGYTYLYYKLNGFKFELKFRIVLVFLLGVLFLTFLKYYNLTMISSISYFIFYPILYIVIGQTNLTKIMYYLFMVWLCGIMLDFSSMLVVSLLHYVFNIDVNSSFFIILMSLYVFLMLILLVKSKVIIKINNLLFKVVSKIRYADFMLIIFTIFVLALAIALLLNLTHLNVGLLIIMIVIMVFFIFVILLRAKYNEIENDIFVETLRKNNDFYINMDKEQNIFKHNLISKLLSVESVSNNKARKLIKDLIKEFNSNIDYSKKIKDIPYGLDGIINEKVYPHSDKIEIKVDNKIEIDIFDVLKPRRYNVLVEKLSLILDNALEACLDSVEKVLVINLYEENNQIFIEVKNTFSGTMSVDDIGKINYSSKGKKHGFGLYSALRNNEVSLDVKVINNMFLAKLTANKNYDVEK